MFEVKRYNGETDQTESCFRINSGERGRYLVDQENRNRPQGSSDNYSLHEVTGPWES